MPLKPFRPLTPSQRYTVTNAIKGLTKKRPEPALTEPLNKTGGRNCYGRLTSSRRGGGHKRLYRIIDFRRADKLDLPGKVVALEYDPNRSANIALIEYGDGDKSYILSPNGLNIGDTIVAATTATSDRICSSDAEASPPPSPTPNTGERNSAK